MYGYGYEIIPVTRWGWGWDKSLITVGFGYEDGDTFFLRDGYGIAKHVPALPRCHP